MGDTLEGFLETFGAPLGPGDSWADRAQRASAKRHKEDRAMWTQGGYQLPGRPGNKRHPDSGRWLPLNEVHPAFLYEGLVSLFGKWNGKDAREYVEFKRSKGSITDLQVQAMKSMGAPYWGKRYGRRAMDEYWTGEHTTPRFITDMGHKVIATSIVAGKTVKLDLGRYAVWAYDERGKDLVLATGNNLRELKKKYGRALPVVSLRRGDFEAVLSKKSKGQKAMRRRKGQRARFESSGPDNLDRAEWASFAVASHSRATRAGQEPMEDQIGDLLCNLLHLAASNDIDVNKALTRAEHCYRAEVREQEETWAARMARLAGPKAMAIAAKRAPIHFQHEGADILVDWAYRNAGYGGYGDSEEDVDAALWNIVACVSSVLPPEPSNRRWFKKAEKATMSQLTGQIDSDAAAVEGLVRLVWERLTPGQRREASKKCMPAEGEPNRRKADQALWIALTGRK